MRQRWQVLTADPERGGGRASLSWIIIVPAILALVLTGTQAAIYFYARNLALHAAQAGVLAGRTEPVSTNRAQQRASAFLDQSAGDWISGRSVTSTAGDVVRVTVTGQSLVIVPGLTLTISQTSAGGVERPAP